MRATEARSKSYWNQLPKEVQECIMKDVEQGQTFTYLYKETYSNLFIDICIIKQALVELGYGVTHEKLCNDVERLIIRW